MGRLNVFTNKILNATTKHLKEISIGFEGKDRDIFLVDDLRFELGDPTLAS